MSNSTAILATLNRAEFDVIRDENRASTLDWAVRMLDLYKGQVAKWESSGSYSTDRKTFPKCAVPNHLLNRPNTGSVFTKDIYNRYKAAAENTTVNINAVLAAADQEWEDSKAFYAARVGEKLDILLGGDAAVVLTVGKDRELVGCCTAILGDKELVLETSMKTNYRYGENSANGDLTIYRQVPTVVRSAKGFDPAAVEAAHEAAKLAAKTDRKATIARLANEVETAEKRKRLWDDIATTLGFAKDFSNGVLINGNLDSVQKNWAKLGNAGKPLPTLLEAKLALKEAREIHKAAKLALKEVKAAK